MALIILSILFWLLAPIINGNMALDIHMHDTYVIVAHQHIWFVGGSILAFFAMIYFIFRKCLKSRRFNWIHIISTNLLLMFLFWPIPYVGVHGMPRRYFSISHWDLESFSQFGELNPFIFMVGVLFLLLQLIFVLYLLKSLINCSTNRKLSN